MNANNKTQNNERYSTTNHLTGWVLSKNPKISINFHTEIRLYNQNYEMKNPTLNFIAT